MNTGTIALIITQSFTFVALIVNLILPYVRGDVPSIDTTVQNLIITQSITFVMLLISEVMSALDPSSKVTGILKGVLVLLGYYKETVQPVATQAPPLIVQSS
jgi:hypothetical protein